MKVSSLPFRLRYFIFVFAYTLLVSIFIQKVVVPAIPGLDSGNGLMANTDAAVHHRVAMEIFQQIAREGWSSFQWGLYQGDRSFVSEVTAIFYVLFSPHPAVLLPLNAIIHALSAVLLLLVFEKCLGTSRNTVLATSPFIFFPSSASWYAQLHRDGYFILGFYLILYAWVRLFEDRKEVIVTENVKSVFFAFIGYLIMVHNRPYVLKLLGYFSPFLFLFILVSRVRAFRSLRISKRDLVVSLFFALVILVSMKGFEKIELRSKISLVSIEGGDASGNTYNYEWSRIGLPSFVESSFYSIALVRSNFLNRPVVSDSDSQVDRQVEFHSVWDVIKYTPRALQIAFLSPFPKHWFQRGASSGSRMMRIFAGMEMLVVYLALCSFFLHLRKVVSRPEAILTLVLSIGFLLFYSYIINNLGGLYRYRFPYLILVTGLGIASATDLWKRLLPKVSRLGEKELS